MATSAGDLNRRVQAYRRPARPASADQAWPAHAPINGIFWGSLRELGENALDVGSFNFASRRARLTIRDSAFGRSISQVDRLLVDVTMFAVLTRSGATRQDGDLTIELQEAPSRTMYANEMDQRGEQVKIVRQVRNGQPITATVRAIVSGYIASELVGAIQQGDRKLLVSGEDLEASGLPLPIQTAGADRVWVRGEELTPTRYDDSTHRDAGTLNAVELTARG